MAGRLADLPGRASPGLLRPAVGLAMTNSQPHLKPKPRQLSYLKDLARKAGESFTYPQTRAQASAEIKRLLGRRRLTPAERRRELFEARCEAGERHGDGAAVRPSEISGYGSSATWS
jgi:hypothetical protein